MANACNTTYYHVCLNEHIHTALEGQLYYNGIIVNKNKRDLMCSSLAALM